MTTRSPKIRKPLGTLIARDKYLLLMFLPVFLYYLVFAYLPMVGLVMGFEDFRMGSGFEGLFTSKWVGTKWFSQRSRSFSRWPSPSCAPGRWPR